MEHVHTDSDLAAVETLVRDRRAGTDRGLLSDRSNDPNELCRGGVRYGESFSATPCAFLQLLQWVVFAVPLDVMDSSCSMVC